MNLMDTILNANGGNAVHQLSRQFGLGDDQTVAAIQSLLPALAGGMQRNVNQPGGLESLLGALVGGQHQRYLEQPEALGTPQTVDDGNGILGHLFGSKDVSRQVASHASAQTGIGSDILKQMLPVVAAMAMGALSKNSMGRETPAGAGEGVLGMLTPFIDQNRDGSTTDDIMGMVGRLFSR